MSLREKVIRHLDSLQAGPKRSLGQNFLINESIIRKIVEAGDPGAFTNTIEVGPGLGALTESLLLRSSDLTLVEFDNAFFRYWKEERKCNVIQVDALKAPWKELIGDNTVLISNLPYQISSRLLLEMTILNPAPQRMVLMFQKEVAQRIQASENQSDYSLMSVMASTFWNTRTILEAGSVDFYPKPNVASRVLQFDRKTNFEESFQKSFFSFIKLCFEQKKKKLINRLSGSYGKDIVAGVYETQGLDSNVRVSQMAPEALLELFKALKS